MVENVGSPVCEVDNSLLKKMLVMIAILALSNEVCGLPSG
jgi:hypothetical protein